MNKNESRQPPAAPEARRRRRRRWPWLVLLLAVATVGGLRLALPGLVERGAAWGSRQYLGLPVRIDNVDFELLAGRVVVEGLSVAARPDEVAPLSAALDPPPIAPESALLHLARVETRLSWSDLRRRTARLRELVVEAPSVRLEQERDGRIDPLRHARPVVPPAGPDAEPHPSAEPGEPWQAVVESFDLHGPRLRLFLPDSARELLSFSLDRLGLTDVAAVGNDFALGALSIENPVLKVRRTLLFADLAEAEAELAAVGLDPVSGDAPAAEGEAGPAQPTTPLAARIEKIDIDGANFTWITRDGPLDVTLTLDASDVALEEGHRFPLEMKLGSAGGTIEIAGQAGLLPPAYTGSVRWSELRFPPLLRAALPDLPRWLETARAEGELEVDADVGGAKGAPAVRLSGQVQLADFAIASPDGEEISVAWDRLGIEIRAVVAPLPQEGKPTRTVRVALGAVELEGPKLLYTQPSPQLVALLAGESESEKTPDAAGRDLAAAAPAEANTERGPTEAAAESPPAPDAEPTVVDADAAAAPVDLEIASIAISGGDLTFFDRDVKPPARTRLRELSLRANDVRFPALQALGVDLAALLPDKGKLTVTGDLRPVTKGDFEIVLDKLYLPAFGSYAAAAGATLEDGEATLKTRARIRGDQIELNNDLLLDAFDVSLSDPSSFQQAFGMPVELALALLRDPFGRITLSVPVKVDEGSSGVGMATIVRTAVQQALIGALAAPLKLVGFGVSSVGRLVGVDSKDGFSMKPLLAPAGSLEPTDNSRQRLAGFAQLLAERPGIAITLRGRAGPADAAAIASGALVPGQGAAPGAVVTAGQKQKSFFRRILDRIRSDRLLSGDDEGAAAQLSADERALEVRDGVGADARSEAVDALATSRAERVRALLIEAGADPDRIMVSESAEPGGPGVVISLGAR